MADKGPKRKPPPVLGKILELDAAVTKQVVAIGRTIIPIKSARNYYKFLEYSCHGIPWLAFWIAFTWIFNKQSLISLQINMLMGIFLDAFVVCVTKAFVRRRRPSGNVDDAFVQVSVDKFSFPSGHASRACYVAFFFTHLWPAPWLLMPLIWAWAVAVCVSRVLMSRHYVLDVLGGAAIGVLEALAVAVLWIDTDLAVSLLSYLSEEKWTGAEYDV